ncbi:DEAD/DEAH box helicase [Clostridium sp. YIM B02515]|uniref:DEAD/DEAH box helicase n=1 Tax=Clostridium rhizosphaerae TaxID=2803861 RepID=A0ABS1T8F1_9CLOT|nr:DEAD/DEAH box helicase [Clostridium rhizosphaerae]MBL4935615.1 DEAD/DEAH box helicase [Clostridium rhizosphaerae]
MNLIELKSIVLKSASSAMKREGENAFKKGLVTYFKGRKIDNIYHIYGRVKDESTRRELNTHIKINLQKKKLESIECSCDEFKEFSLKGYTFMCSHLTASAYKFFNLLSKGKDDISEEAESKASSEEKKIDNTGGLKLTRKTDKDSEYYEVLEGYGSEKRILQPSELRTFLESIKTDKIKFKYDYIEFTTPIFHKDIPVTFNLKEDSGRIILTTHKKLPIYLNSSNDVFYYKNELYLPSKKQIDSYMPLYEKLKSNGAIAYKKDIDNYNKLIFLLNKITKNINIAENLKNFAAKLLKIEFFVYEEKGKVYADIFLNYGIRKINILDEIKGTDSSIRDFKREERLLMEIEKYSFVISKKRFMFTGTDEELFNILAGRTSTIHSLGKVVLGKGLKERQIYGSSSIKADLYEQEDFYNFSYSIGNIERAELRSAFEKYEAKAKFYKTKNNDFIDFEDDGVRSFFNLFDVLDINKAVEQGETELTRDKALYLLEAIHNKGLDFINGFEALEKIESMLNNLNSIEIDFPKNFNGTLREYQIKGFKWLKTLSELGFGGILADEMGLGKTIQTIAFILSEEDKKFLIVCPTSLIFNWKEEIEKFAKGLKVLIMHGSERTESAEDINEYDVILTTYGTLRMDIDFYKGFVFDFFIIDEAQNIKNASAQNTQVVKEIKAKTKFALTGTPMENNLAELWSIFDFIMPGYLYSKQRFEEKFILKYQDNLESLKLLIKPFVLRRTKKEVIKELPDKIEKKLLIEMTAAQKAVYSTYIKSVRELVKNSDSKIEIFSYLTKLRQLCLDPSLIIEDYEGGSGKLEMAIELIKDHIESEGKVLLFSQFTSVLDKLGESLKEEGIEFFYIDGKTKPKDRIQRVKDFNSSKDINVFLISLKAGGTGLNLTSANLVIHFDPWWNPAVEAQASDRAHRIGQKNLVEVIKLVARGTIEEKIVKLQEDKKELIDKVLTESLENSGLMNSLTKEQLAQLFIRD